MMKGMQKTIRHKVLLYGIDGATWDIIDPLLKQGKLPNLKGIIETGVRGVLKSIEPPVSPMVWTSIATGKLPEKHGVKDFIVTSKSVKCKRIWNILQENGWKVGLMDYLVTWPPDRVNGFCIPSHFAHGPETYPETLSWINKLLIESKKEGSFSIEEYATYITKFLKYGVSLKTILNSAFFHLNNKLQRLSFYDYFYPVRKIKIEIRTEILKNLYKGFHVDFLAYVTNLVDATSHNYWKFYQPEKFQNNNMDRNKLKKYGSFLPDAYIQSDRTLGKMLKLFNDKLSVVIVSDHGFQANTEEDTQVSLTMKPQNIAKILQLENNFRYFNIGGSAIFRTVDDNTEAEMRLKQNLLKFKIHDSSTSVFNIKESKLYNVIVTLNKYIDYSAGDKLRVQAPDGNIYKLDNFAKTSGQSISGTHHPDGIIILNGPMFKNGVEIYNASVLDVTPTILYSLNLPIAKDFDGKILKNAFKNEFFKESNIRFVDSYDGEWKYKEDDAVMENVLKKRLEDLGYL